MSRPKPSAHYRLHIIAQWLGVLAMLLALGDGIVHAFYPVSQRSFAHILLEPEMQAWMHGALALSGTLSLLLYQQSRRSSLRLVHLKESALRASDARLRSFFEATPDGLLISDAHGTITMVNQQIVQLLGYAKEELLGMSIEELVPAHSRRFHQKLREDFVATPSARRKHQAIGVKALCKDGQTT